MKANNELVKYKNNRIKKFMVNIFNKIRSRYISSSLLDENIISMIHQEFPNEWEQIEVKELLEDLLTRNHGLLETLDIRMLHKDMVGLFSKPTLERIITDEQLQRNILELSQEELRTYAYLLNYKVVDINDRIGNLFPFVCKNIDINELQTLNEEDRLKAVSIILSNSEFRLSNLSELDDYYEKRRNMCEEIINQPDIVKQEYDKDLNSENEISNFPFELLYEMNQLSDLDIVKYAIVEAKYGMSLEKAKLLCSAFSKNVNEIEQSEDTRIIRELKAILKEEDIKELRKIDLEEDSKNYVGTINIIPNLKNAYIHKYQETLYQIKEEDYIGSQSIKLKGRKRADIKIYNALGKNNDKADFNMILTSLGGIYFLNHNYDDLKNDWDRADKNHTISCSYIGNDFLGVVYDNYLLAFSDITENELLQSKNDDGATFDSAFYHWYDLSESEFLTPQNQINSSKIYNELLVERKTEKEGILENRKPTYAVFMAETLADIQNTKDERWKETKRLAAQLDIPIVVIDQTQCAKLEFDKVQEMIELVKREKRMDLIPTIIHKIENNKAAPRGIGKGIRDSIFSETKIKKCLEEMIGTIMISDIDTFNQGIEQFVKTTKELKKTYEEHTEVDEKCKTYDYEDYINRLKILYTSRNGLNGDGTIRTKERNIEEEQLDTSYGEIDFHNQ